MRTLSFILLHAIFFAVLAGVAAPTFAQESAGLSESMGKISDMYKQLARGLRKPDPAKLPEYQQWIADLIKESELATTFSPKMSYSIDDKEKQAAFVADYKKDMEAFVATLKELQTHLLAGDLEKAQATVKMLKKHKAEGHQKFQED